MRFVAVAAALGVLAAAVAPVFIAGRDHPDAVPTVQQVSHRTMSPFCPGLNLEECPSSQATELRNRIAERINAGATNAEIDSWLVSEYGESVSGRPRSAASWAVPLAATAAGLAALVYAMSSRKRVPGERDTELPELPEEERDRLEADLKRFTETNE